MAENETPAPELAVSEAPQAEPAEAVQSEMPATEPKAESTPTLTLEQVREALLPEIKKELKAAYDASRRAENKADMYRQRADQYAQSLEERLEELATQGMEEEKAELWRLRRQAERDKLAAKDPEISHQRDQAEFQVFAQSVARAEGLDLNDPKLSEMFERRAQGSKGLSDWKTALGLAVADYHKFEVEKIKSEATQAKTEVEKSRGEAAERERKVREDERAKAKNEKRVEAGPVDRGQPSGEAPKDWYKASDEDVLKEIEKRKKAGQARRMSQYR